MDTVRRPDPDNIARALRGLAPWRALTSPQFYGLERVPEERPLLFVGNHTLYGILDAPLLFAELYTRRGIFLRSLGDHLHFKVPLWRDLMTEYGVVDGTRENCAKLMDAGEAVLVFPGGGREVAKRKGEKYKLIWKERVGFARMAIQHACTIVPFAAVGAEEAYDIVVDADEIMASPLGQLVKKLRIRPEVIPPIARGAGGTALPRAERFYFYFAEPIRTHDYDRRADDDERCRELRDRVQREVEAGVAWLRAQQAKDPERKLGPRMVKAIARKITGKKR
jgi:1-acyl-sn-glycerol-3-phosphate acyltransferase